VPRAKKFADHWYINKIQTLPGQAEGSMIIFIYLLKMFKRKKIIKHNKQIKGKEKTEN
jgi:hypothetical protein